MDQAVNPNELIKARSNHLRGTLQQSLADAVTGAISADDVQVAKFHGFYQQDDRDIRQQRQQQKLEPYYSFMLRARLPGGVCSTDQWKAIDAISQQLGNGSIRLTTRQTFQFHGILKQNLKPLIQQINQAMIDSIGGCGDINRNIMCNPDPQQSSLHAQVFPWAQKISEHLLPKTRAYHEIWLDGEKLEQPEVEPVYGDTYLPRKFKTAIAIPPQNDVDIFTNDMGFVAIADGDELIGFNVLAGGGMGTTHGDKSTYPRLADELGFVTLDQVIAVAEAIVTVQRDEGNRVERKLARLKYTVDRLGVEKFKQLVEKRAGVEFAPAKPVEFAHQGDRFGWHKGNDDNWSYTLYIENGRVIDNEHTQIMSALREIAEIHSGDFRITPSQNLLLAGIDAATRPLIEQIIERYGLDSSNYSPLRRNGIACASLPTCPQAMAEAERYFPDLLQRIEGLLDKHELQDLDTVIRMTGCPNGCARPFAAEVGLVGKAPGRYNLLLGGDGHGLRLNKLYRENLDEAQILQTLDDILADYAQHAEAGERVGDFVIRRELVSAVVVPKVDFHG